MYFRGVKLYLRQRFWILVSLAVITPLSFWIWRCYDGPLRIWINFYISGIFYVLFWCLFLFFFWPKKKYAARIAVLVLLATCGLEFLQLYKPPFLQQIRSTFLGMAVLGTCFVWRQFPYYIIGALLSWLWMHALARLVRSKQR